MKNNVTFPLLPKLAQIDFSCTAQVRELARERYLHMFGVKDDAYIDDYMDVTEELFTGNAPDYQANDTAYHDISHTLQAALCLVELLHHRHLEGAAPRIDADDFRRALVAVLFHDIGYLKKTGDTSGSGAKYTHLHEKRSCSFARELLSQRGWPQNDIQFVENLISATGPSADVTRVGFRSEIERVLGQSVCTADYIGQMSDPHYPEKLEILFGEFRESYLYQQIPEQDWPFASFEDLLRSSPEFWAHFVQHKLEVECAGVVKHLKHPVTGENPYMQAVERNLARIENQITRL
ncbi:MAG: HD domain-containing protein [Xanthomonadales bacterium]|nr:HD domain-containing protein [Gammaproteobacteria bacterium]MBT8055212.1 HD domain-containing protein [Gammaproteobacteria bacterium]NND56958.1 HD domain-containing protein [Xanthomonadales bacterium]NNK51916.1 HD domain-containing protein [Xanthomonadales bacterium]